MDGVPAIADVRFALDGDLGRGRELSYPIRSRSVVEELCVRSLTRRRRLSGQQQAADSGKEKRHNRDRGTSHRNAMQGAPSVALGLGWILRHESRPFTRGYDPSVVASTIFCSSPASR